MSPIKKQIIDDILDNTKNEESELDKLQALSIQELLCLRMLLAFYQSTNRNLDTLNIGVAFFDGVYEDSNKDQLNYLEFDRSNKRRFTGELIIGKGDKIDEFYGRVIDKFMEGPHREKSYDYEWTNFTTILQELDRHLSSNEDTTIITIISDFYHEKLFKLPDGRSKTSRLEQVEESLEDLIRDNSEKIRQINLVKIPKEDVNEIEWNDINYLINTFKSHFNYTFYYEVDALLLVNEQDIHNRICEIIAPTEASYNDKEKQITFYYPYRSELGNSKEARGILKFNPTVDNGKLQFDCFLSLQSKEIINALQNDVRLNLKLPNSGGGTYSRTVGVNKYISENIVLKKEIDGFVL